MRKLADVVADKADLNISCVKICSAVNGFGNYVEINKNELEYHQGQSVYIYCELQNVKHQMNVEGKYLTRLHATMILRDLATYAELIKPLSEDVEDAPIFNKRNDFFLRGEISCRSCRRASMRFWYQWKI